MMTLNCFTFFDCENSETPINTNKPSHPTQSRRNHIKLTRVFREILKTLVFIGISGDWAGRW